MKRAEREDLIPLVAAGLLAALLALGFDVVMGRLFVPEAFGRLSVALTLYALGAALLSAGFPWVAARALARFASPRRRKRVFKSALLGNTLFGFVLAAVLQIVYLRRFLPLDAAYAPLIAVSALGLMWTGPQAVLHGALYGLGRVDASGALRALGASSSLALGALGVLLGYGAAGAVFGPVGGGLVMLLFSAFLLRGFRFWQARGLAPPADWQADGFFFLGAAGLLFLLRVDVLGVRFFSPLDADVQAGYFQAAASLARLPVLLSLGAAAAVFPLAEGASPGRTLRILKTALRRAAPWLLLLHAALALFAPQVIGLVYPPDFAPAAGVLRLLALGALPLDVLCLLAAALQTQGETRLPALTLMAALALEWGGLNFLVPRFGLEGAAAALGIAAGAAALLLSAVAAQGYLHPLLAEEPA